MREGLERARSEIRNSYGIATEFAKQTRLFSTIFHFGENSGKNRNVSFACKNPLAEIFILVYTYSIICGHRISVLSRLPKPVRRVRLPLTASA